MSLSTRAFLWVLVTGTVVLLSHATFDLKCRQGEFLNQTSTGRLICEKCPNNTYWVMRLNEEGEVIGVGCESCPLWQTSPAGSLDFSYCRCDSENCNTSTKDSSMGMIIGIIIAIIVLGAVIAALFWCKTYGPELARALSGRDAAEAEIAADRDDGYTRMLPGDSSSPNLLDCDIAIEITDEQLDDTGYNNETAQGDHNDFNAVLRAAVISEKRRSRIVSMSSVTELDRYRTGSMSSMSGRAFANPPGYGPLQNQQSPSHHSGQQASPQPKYAEFAHLNKAQTVL